MAARALLALALPKLSSACAVCFGRSAGSQGLVSGLTWGLFILIGATFMIMAALAVTVIRIERRRAQAERLLP